MVCFTLLLFCLLCKDWEGRKIYRGYEYIAGACLTLGRYWSGASRGNLVTSCCRACQHGDSCSREKIIVWQTLWQTSSVVLLKIRSDKSALLCCVAAVPFWLICFLGLQDYFSTVLTGLVHACLSVFVGVCVSAAWARLQSSA